LADPSSLQLSDIITMLRVNMRGPGEESAYDYGADDHGWFVVPRVGEPFELPLTAELQSNWELLAEQDPRCAPMAERISELRGARVARARGRRTRRRGRPRRLRRKPV
jgi:hypothetical protein